MKNLTIIFYTANVIPEEFASKLRKNLWKVRKDLPIISVSHQPMDFGENIFMGNMGRSHLNIYRQALIGAKKATTKYIALAEDDVLYAPDHFHCYRPEPGIFAYNMNVWSLYTWQPDIFSYKDRINLSGLICERELFIEAMEERFKRWPFDNQTPIRNWAEPGKYEKNLSVTIREKEEFYSDIANIAFSHPTALSYLHLGTRKRLGKLRATALPHWGSAEEIKNLYV